MGDLDDLNAPVLPGTAATDYERYLRTDELLTLQKTAAEVVHRDEHLFQAVHQSSELWLKLACLEIEAAVSLVDADRAAAATRLVRRGCDAMLLLTSQLAMLEHMSPCDYAIYERRWATARASTRRASAASTGSRPSSVRPSTVC